jgi:hypothetical protein
MAFQNRVQTNFTRGEVSPSIESRGDIDIFQSALKLCRNWIPKFQGPVSFAPGTTFITASSIISGATIIPFVYRDTQAFHLELFVDGSADLNIRILSDDGVVLYAGSDLGWVVNDNVGAGTTDSELIGFPGGIGKDPGFVSSGIDGAEVSIKVTGTFTTADLQNVRYAQSGSAMVILSEGKFCIQVWRGASSNTAWAINEASVISSSFVVVSNVASDGNGYAEFTTTTVHGLVVGDIALIKNTDDDISYDGAFKVTAVADTTHFTTKQKFIGYTTAADDRVRKGGTFHDFVFSFEEITDFISALADIPKEVKFNDGRLYFVIEDKMYGSRSVVDGQDMYTNFSQSISALPTDAVEFTASISSDKVDLFKWLKVSGETFYAGMENLIAVIDGNTADDPIAGDSIRLKSAEDRGSSDVAPIEDGKDIIFVDSTGKKVNSFKFDLLSDSQRSTDLSILAEHFFDTPVKRVAFQRGITDIVWVLLTNGRLLGFVYKSSENIAGWFEIIDANSELYSDISVLPISNGADRLWVVVARSDGTATGKEDQIEQLNIELSFVKFVDFYTNNKVEDTRRWKNAVYEQQKHAANMHSMLSTDAFATTLANDHYLHFSQDLDEVFVSTAGTVATKLTGGASPLNGEDGNKVVIKATTKGLGEGQYNLDNYVTGTGITDITEEKELADFVYNSGESSFIIPPGSWSISFSSITSPSLQRYFDSTGADIDVVLDGGFVSGKTIVKNGSAYTVDLGTLNGTVIYFGYKYVGVIATLQITVGGVTGTAFSKLKNIDEVRVSFIDSINVKYGVDLYNLNSLAFRIGSGITDRPPSPFNGVKALTNTGGSWENKKNFYIVQDIPVPCTVSAIDISGDASDE